MSKIIYILILSVIVFNQLYAAQIAVENPGFEDPCVPDVVVGQTWAMINPYWWDLSGDPCGVATFAGLQMSDTWGSAVEGYQVCFIRLDPAGDIQSTTLSQTLSDKVVAGNGYAFSFYEFNQFVYPIRLIGRLKFNDAVVSSLDITVPAAPQPWDKLTLPVYVAQSSDGGKVITIEIVALAVNQSNWAQVCLDNVAIETVDTLQHTYNPMPTDGRTATGLPSQLSWSAAKQGGPYTNNLYFGTEPNNLSLVYTGSNLQYALPILKYYTTYYWRVDEVNGATTLTGYVWSFNTGGAVCSSALPGDINGDCRLNFEDFALMAQNWMLCTRVNGACP